MNGHSNFISEVFAVLVIYETVPGQSSTFQSIETCVRRANGKLHLLIYDNSRDKQIVPASEHLVIHYEHDSTNGGVSKAYNFGSRLAKSLEKKWLWLLDQDDEFSDRTIEAYNAATKGNPSESIFVPIVLDEKEMCSPFRIRFGGGWRIPEVVPGIYPLHQFLFINSGLMISVAEFERTQGYDENFPLDFSDLDFIQRLKKNNNMFVVVSATIKHSLSINTGVSAEKQLTRFRSYLSAAKLFRKKYPVATRSIVLRSLFMASKLGVRHRSLSFIKEYFILWK